MNAEERLLEWAHENFYPGWAEPSPSGTLAAIAGRRPATRGAMADYARQRALQRQSENPVVCKETRSTRMELVTHEGDSVLCPPDGGLGAMVDRMAASIDRSRRCREVGELLAMMPRDLWGVVDVTYRSVMNPREIPREAEEAWRMLQISRATYFRRKRAMLVWLGYRLGMAVDQEQAA